MRDICGNGLLNIISDQIFLTRYTHNSIIETEDLIYLDFITMAQMIYNEMKAEEDSENSASGNNGTHIPTGASLAPPPGIRP